MKRALQTAAGYQAKANAETAFANAVESLMAAIPRCVDAESISRCHATIAAAYNKRVRDHRAAAARHQTTADVAKALAIASMTEEEVAMALADAAVLGTSYYDIASTSDEERTAMDGVDAGGPNKSYAVL